MRARKFVLVPPVVTGDPAFRVVVAVLPAELADRVTEDVGPALEAAAERSNPGVHVSASMIVGALLLQGVADLTAADGRKPSRRRVKVAIGSYLALYTGGLPTGGLPNA